MKKCVMESTDTHEELTRKADAIKLLAKKLKKRGDDEKRATDENTLNQGELKKVIKDMQKTLA